jgi:hypothetical protein
MLPAATSPNFGDSSIANPQDYGIYQKSFYQKEKD